MSTLTLHRWAQAYHDGMRYFAEGDYERAQVELTTAVDVAEHMRPRDERLGCSLFALARLSQLNGQLDEAARLLHRALEVESHALGSEHPYTAQVAHGYAELLRRIGQPPRRTRARRCQPVPTATATPSE